jgi:hypothetical protein
LHDLPCIEKVAIILNGIGHSLKNKFSNLSFDEMTFIGFPYSRVLRIIRLKKQV